MGNPSKLPIVCLLMFIVAMGSATMVCSEFPPAVFFIFNMFSAASLPPENPSPNIQVTCRYQNTETVIEEQTLKPKENVKMVFSPNIWGTSWYNCDFKWGPKTENLVVWTDSFFMVFWNKRPCKLCMWTVDERGFTEFYESVLGREIGFHPWDGKKKKNSDTSEL